MTDTERINKLKALIVSCKKAMKSADDRLVELTKTKKSEKENFEDICDLKKDYFTFDIVLSTYQYILEELFDERG